MTELNSNQKEILDISNVDFYKDFTAWLILKAISDFMENLSEEEKNKKYKDYPFKADQLHIEFKINGINLPFTKTIQLLEKQLNLLIVNKAKELLNDQFCKMYDSLDEFQRELNHLTNDKLQKFSTNIED